MILAVLQVSRPTFYTWFSRWQTGGLAGLAHVARQGRRPILGAANADPVAAVVRANRQQLKAQDRALDACQVSACAPTGSSSKM